MIIEQEVITICKANYDANLITQGALLVGMRKVRDIIGSALYKKVEQIGYEELLEKCKVLAAWSVHALMVDRIATEMTNKGVYQLYTVGSNGVQLTELTQIKAAINEITTACANEIKDFIQERVAAKDPLYVNYVSEIRTTSKPSLVSNTKRVTQI